MGFSDAPLSTLLWRRGGPPAAPRSAELLEAGTELRALAAPLEALPESGGGAALLGGNPTHPALWADAPQRRALLNGACMVAWAGSASRREVRAAAPRLREIPLALRAQQEARHARAEAGAAAGQLPLSVRAAAPLWCGLAPTLALTLQP